MFWNHNRHPHDHSSHHTDRDCERGSFGHRHDAHRDRGRGRQGGPWNRQGQGAGTPGPWDRMFGGEPPRADRGAVRFLILDSLLDQPRHGYEVIQVIEERSKGAYRPSPGVVYPTLQMLEDVGHLRAVTGATEGRKAFELTADGKADLAANRDLVDDFYERASDSPAEQFAEAFHGIKNQLGQLMRVFRRAFRRGQISASTLTKVGKVLDETTQKIEEIFNESGASAAGDGED